ncbi:helix-turn-helix domain-containing protein [Nonomuraea sp. B12E4]|uniref:AraC-like ligand-binding domain-containing protein n=1 Tax=Nonomuraea sp. B12E4 TaxID=3153564 RepID=UPI00325E7D36
MQQLSLRTIRSTEDVAAGDAFAYWSDVICDTLVHVAARATGKEPFRGWIEHTVLDGIGWSTLSSGPQQVTRTRRMIARDQEEFLLVNIQTAGQAVIRQDERAATLAPRSMTFLDSTRPYTLEFGDPFSQVVVQVPRSLLSGRSLDDVTALTLGPHGPARLVADFLVGLEQQQREDPVAAAALLPHAVGLLESILGLAARESTPHPSATALARERVHRFVQRHVHDPGLDAAAVAAGCGMSRRTLFRALAADGEPLTTLIRRLRVAQAQQLLRARPALPIAAVALNCGFAGTAQLHRAFRSLTGTTPGAYRTGGERAQEPAPL